MRNSTVFKLIASLILITLAFGFVSCSKEEPEDSSTVLPGETPENDKYADLLGLPIRIAYYTDVTSSSSVLSYISGSILGDKLQSRFDTINKEHNCNISLLPLAAANVSTASAAAGTNSAEIAYSGSQQTFHELASGGVLNDLADYIDILDYENNNYKWGTVYARELGMYDGIQYTLNPYSWPETRPSVASILTANEDLIQRYGKTDPREMIEQKNWSWDSFEAYLADCTFNDGVDYYGIGSNNFRDVISGYFLGNGCSVITYNPADGTYTTDLETPEGLAAIERALVLGREHTDWFYKGKITLAIADTAASDCFIEGTTFIWQTTSSVYTSYIAYNMKNTAFLPFPVGPNGTYGEWAGFTYGQNSLGMFLDVDDAEYVAYVLNQICEPLDGIEDYDALLSYYSNNVFYDSRDAELFLTINDNARYTMNYYPVGGHTFWTNLGTTKKSAAEYIEANLPAQKVIIEKYMLPNAEYIAEMLSR